MVSQPDKDLLSIGDVAAATGISTDTIRVWERRYGRPDPVRLPSGHRRYTRDQVHWLRKVAEALAAGARPSKVVKGGDEELEKYLVKSRRKEPEDISPVDLANYLVLVRHYRESDLLERLWSEWNEHGPEVFITRRLAPMVTEVGSRWAAGELDVRHEHFLSEVVEYFLRAARLGIAVSPKAPLMVLTTLEGEQHRLGLQMASVMCVVEGGRVRVLGSETPIEEVVKAALEARAAAVGLSVSLATGGVETDRRIALLRQRLPESVRLVIGGMGARGIRRGPRHVEYTETMADFQRWVRDWCAHAQAA